MHKQPSPLLHLHGVPASRSRARGVASGRRARGVAAPGRGRVVVGPGLGLAARALLVEALDLALLLALLLLLLACLARKEAIAP